MSLEPVCMLWPGKQIKIISTIHVWSCELHGPFQTCKPCIQSMKSSLKPCGSVEQYRKKDKTVGSSTRWLFLGSYLPMNNNPPVANEKNKDDEERNDWMMLKYECWATCQDLTISTPGTYAEWCYSPIPTSRPQTMREINSLTGRINQKHITGLLSFTGTRRRKKIHMIYICILWKVMCTALRVHASCHKR